MSVEICRPVAEETDYWVAPITGICARALIDSYYEGSAREVVPYLAAGRAKIFTADPRSNPDPTGAVSGVPEGSLPYVYFPSVLGANTDGSASYLVVWNNDLSQYDMHSFYGVAAAFPECSAAGTDCDQSFVARGTRGAQKSGSCGCGKRPTSLIAPTLLWSLQVSQARDAWQPYDGKWLFSLDQVALKGPWVWSNKTKLKDGKTTPAIKFATDNSPFPKEFKLSFPLDGKQDTVYTCPANQFNPRASNVLWQKLALKDKLWVAENPHMPHCLIIKPC